MSTLRVYVFAADPTSSTPITGLAMADFQVDVHQVNKDSKVQTQLVNNAPMLKEIGGGFYLYVMSGVVLDKANYDYFATVKYTGAVGIDTTLWAEVDDSPIPSSDATLFSFDAFCSLTDAAVTGLTLADFEVDLYRVEKSTNIVTLMATDVAMTVEAGDGHYAYYRSDSGFVLYDWLVLVEYAGVAVLDATLWAGKGTPTVDTAEAVCAAIDFTTDRGKVRLIISDTDCLYFIFTDAEIDGFLSLFTGAYTVWLAAAQALMTMAINETMVSKRIKLLDLTTDGPAVAKALNEKALELRSQVREAIADAKADDFDFDWAEMDLGAFSRREIVAKEGLRDG